MFSVIRDAYLAGRYTDSNIDLFVRVGYLTEDQADEIKTA